MITVRGSNLVSTASVSTYPVPIPAGSLAGDTALIFVGCGFACNTPAGWTAIEITTGANWNGAVFRKELSGADITAGTVTVTTGGSFPNVMGMVTFVGTIGTVKTSISLKNTTGAASRTLTTNIFPKVGNYAFYFGSNRANTVPTSTAGTAMHTSSAANASSVLKGGLVAADGALTSTFGYPVTGSGDFQAIVVMNETAENRGRTAMVYNEAVVETATPARIGGLFTEVLRSQNDGPSALRVGGFFQEVLRSQSDLPSRIEVVALYTETLVSINEPAPPPNRRRPLYLS